MLGLAGLVWIAGALAPARADEIIQNHWTARRGSAKATSPAASFVTVNGSDSLAAAEAPKASSATAASKDAAASSGENKLRWHARRSAGAGETPEPVLGEPAEPGAGKLTIVEPEAGKSVPGAGKSVPEAGKSVAGNLIAADVPDENSIKLTAALEPIPAGTLEPIPASRMPRLAPLRRRGERIASDPKARDRARPQVMTVAAENEGALRDPFADEELQPSRSRLKNPPAEMLPDQQPQPLSNDPFNAPPAQTLPGPNDELAPPANLPSPSDLPAPPPPPQSLFPPEPAKEPTTTPCDSDKKECRTAFDRLKANTIDKIALTIRINGSEGSDFPCECTLGNDPFVWRHWSGTTYTFKAAGTCHKPLYFEDVQLERYGHSLNPALQSIFSGAHFFANVALLPYNIGVNPPNECIYSLGYYRPGDCAPYMIEAFPISVRGAVLEVGAVASGLWILNFYSPVAPVVGPGL